LPRFINSWSEEGADRSELSNTDQDNLVLTVAENCNNTIAVVHVSSSRALEAWIENGNTTALIYSGLLGQESGNIIADSLYGDVNLSGKWIHTIAKNASDYPTSVCMEIECPFSEGVYVDYRWLDKEDIEPRFPLGHGLSYTSFSYGEVTTAITNSLSLASTNPTGQLGFGDRVDFYDEMVSVNTTVQNTGSLIGAEVAQLYLSFPDEADQPVRGLRGFEKFNITPGQTADISFSLHRRDISYRDISGQKWAIASGTHTFSLGSSSRDLQANTTFII
jgi:beta-glucosidase